MAWRNVRGNSKESSSLGADHLVAVGFYFDMNAEHLKDVWINMLKYDWEILVNVLRDPKVEKDVETAHGEVVEEAQEVDA